MHLSYCPKSPFNVTAYMYPKTFRLYLYDIIYDMKKERKMARSIVYLNLRKNDVCGKKEKDSLQ